jgi:hypothetical protein
MPSTPYSGTAVNHDQQQKTMVKRLTTHTYPTQNIIFNLHVADRSILSSEWLENAARTSKH